MSSPWEVDFQRSFRKIRILNEDGLTQQGRSLRFLIILQRHFRFSSLNEVGPS